MDQKETPTNPVIMNKMLLAVVMLAFICHAHAQKKTTASDPRFAGVEAELQKVLDTWKVAGFAVAVIDNNKIIYAKGFGYRDVAKKLPVTPNTLFAIGSCSKAFTSALLGQLQQEGKLDLNDKPAKYIADLKFFNAEMNEGIIIRDLMTHRTGLPRHDYSWYLFSTLNRDSLIARMQYQEPFTGLRKQWYYNNFGFLLQGVITEHLTGKSWEDNVREKLFQPLGMSVSNLTIKELETAAEPARGYELKNDKLSQMEYYDIAAMSPAGSINSSVTEMSNWVMTWINGGKFKGKEIIPASYVSEAISAQMVIPGGLPTKEHPEVHTAGYGYGWFIASYKGHYRAEHGGNIDGFSASTTIYPSDSVGVVVLVNQDGSRVPSVVRNIISDRLLKVARTDWNKEFKADVDKNAKAAKDLKKNSDKVAGTKPSHPLKDYTGRYSNPGYGDITIVLQHDSLFAIIKMNKVWVRHRHYDIFDLLPVEKTRIDTAMVMDPKFNFRGDNSGGIAGLSMEIEVMLDPIEFTRGSIAVADKASLTRYVGDYVLSGMTAKMYIKRDNTLFLFVPGQPEYELVQMEKDKFVIKGLDGYKVNFVEVDSHIDEAVFIQPNGTFKAKKKN